MKKKKDTLLSACVIDSIMLNGRSLKYWLNHPMLFSLFCVELIFGIIGGILGLIFDNIFCLIVGLAIGIPVGIWAGLKVSKVIKKGKN